ncbi:amidohydrolase family protein [Thalassotalea sp. HSM 43]|uniref:amidohydrolase family protein n=1 Tax=Thalassotalea sp. HSM 43 TaxID=2552945 RepID=UPI001678DD4F|nr:amidohydrolase family protein [Thalassotalea sp. HSM 43]
MPIPLIDAHHHLWDIEKNHYPWLAAKGEMRFFGQPDPIRVNYLPADFIEDHLKQVERSVHIQVGIEPSARVHETKWLQQCHNQSNGRYPAKAVVDIDMLATDVEQQIIAQKQYSITQGVRHIIGKSTEENKQLPDFDRDKWLASLQLLVKHQLSFDLQCTSEQYQQIYTVIRQVPELKVAICHLASPWEQTESGFAHWQQYMAKFAALPNVYMKISGFAMFNHGFIEPMFIKYASQAIELFGAQRCMLGSNFPVDKLYMSYQQLLMVWQNLLSIYDQEQQQHLAYNTAQSFYQL